MDFREKLRIQDISAAEQAETMVSGYVSSLQKAVTNTQDAKSMIKVFEGFRKTLRSEMESRQKLDDMAGAVIALVGMFGAEYLAEFTDQDAMDDVSTRQRKVVKQWISKTGDDTDFALRDFIITLRETISDELGASTTANDDICKWITLIGADRFLIMMADNRSAA